MHTSSIEILYDQHMLVDIKPSEAADLSASRNHWGVQAFLDLSDPNFSSYEKEDVLGIRAQLRNKLESCSEK